MQVFFYDQSFEGLLCALFDAYHQKRFPDLLLGLDCVAPLLTSYSTTIQTDNKMHNVFGGPSAIKYLQSLLVILAMPGFLSRRIVIYLFSMC